MTRTASAKLDASAPMAKAKVLTSIATVLLILGVVTSFFGMNFRILPYDTDVVFWLSLVLSAALAGGVALYFHRKGWL